MTVNGKLVKETYIVKHHDVISHFSHRHEPPVTAQFIEKVYESDSILVIDKPPSIPIHPTYAIITLHFHLLQGQIPTEYCILSP